MHKRTALQTTIAVTEIFANMANVGRNNVGTTISVSLGNNVIPDAVAVIHGQLLVAPIRTVSELAFAA